MFEKRRVQGHLKWYSQPWNTQIHKYKFTNTQIQHMTNCQKYPTYATFLNSWWFKYVKNDIRSDIRSEFRDLKVPWLTSDFCIVPQVYLKILHIQKYNDENTERQYNQSFHYLAIKRSHLYHKWAFVEGVNCQSKVWCWAAFICICLLFLFAFQPIIKSRSFMLAIQVDLTGAFNAWHLQIKTCKWIFCKGMKLGLFPILSDSDGHD